MLGDKRIRAIAQMFFPASLQPSSGVEAMVAWEREQAVEAIKRALWENDIKKEPIPDYGQLFELEEFIKCVKGGLFVDDDGSGYYATTEGYVRDLRARPSEILAGFIRRNWTHVMWFNK